MLGDVLPLDTPRGRRTELQQGPDRLPSVRHMIAGPGRTFEEKMPRPPSADEAAAVRKARPCTYIYRAACSHLRCYRTGDTPINAARELYGHDPVTADIIQPAAVPPAAIGGSPTWAANLGGIAVYDMIQDAASVSSAAELIGRALKLNMDGISEYRVPGRLLNPAAAGQWVGEGTAAPVRQLAFSNSALLHPRKLEVRTAYTREQAEHSNIEAVVRQTLSEATGLALDLQMLSSDPGDASKPAGIFASSDTLTPTAGGGLGALDKDLEQLFAALASHRAGKNPIIVAAVPQAVALKRNAGAKFDYDILTSTELAVGTVGVIEVSSLVSGFSSVAEFSTQRSGLLHMEDTSPTDITGDSPSPATPVRSLFQIEGIGLKMTLRGAWGLRASGHAQWIKNVTW